MKKNLRVVSVIISIILLSTLTGCEKNKQENDESMEKIEQTEPLATKEYLMDYYGLTEEDLEGIDVDRIIEYYAMTDKVITMSTRENIVGFLKILQTDINTEIEEENYDLGYLLEAPEFEGEYPSFDEIKYLAFSQNESEGGYSLLYDFENGIAYGFNGGGSLHGDYRDANETYKLSDEFKSKMIQALKDAKVNEWDYYYEDNTYQEPVCWYFGMEFNDGTVISNTGVARVPKTLVDIENVMESVRNSIE